jgi:hypothetical protein
MDSPKRIVLLKMPSLEDMASFRGTNANFSYVLELWHFWLGKNWQSP